MSLLLTAIKGVDRPAADVLQKVGVFTDSEILALTREDLRDLFPKPEDFQRRRILFDTIHKWPIAEQVLEKLKGFIPHDFLRAGLTNNGVLVDYLQLLKGMKTQMNVQMSFIDAHIGFLEEFSKDHPDSRQTGHFQGGGGSSTSDAGGQQCKPTDGSPLEPQGEIMSLLLTAIRDVDTNAAGVLQKVGVFTDSEILTLTREDLSDLFPKPEDFQRRRTLFDTIHKQPIAEQVLKKLKGFIPHASLRAGLTNNGVLVDYLQLLKGMKTRMNVQMSFIDAHIGFLEEFSKDQPDSRQTGPSQGGGGSSTSDAGGQQCKPTDGSPMEPQALYSGQSASTTGGPVGRHGGQSGGSSRRAPDYGASDTADKMELDAVLTGDSPQGAPAEFYSGQSASTTSGPVEPHHVQSGGSSKRARGSGASYAAGQRKHHVGSTDGYSSGTDGEPFTILSPLDCVEPRLLCKMVVSGKTFDHHLTLMENVKKQVPNRIRLCDDQQDYKLTFLFCPISSRIGADVVAAMAHVKDDKPIILVLMHHTREVKAVTSMRTWSDDANVVLRVNVFFHETTGLLKCEENDAAVTEMKNTLLASFIQGSNDTGGNAQGGGARLKGMMSSLPNPFSSGS